MDILFNKWVVTLFISLFVGYGAYILTQPEKRIRVTKDANIDLELFNKANDEVLVNIKSVMLTGTDLKAFHKTVVENVAKRYGIPSKELYNYDLTVSLIIDDIMQCYYLSPIQKQELSYRLMTGLDLTSDTAISDLPDVVVKRAQTNIYFGAATLLIAFIGILVHVNSLPTKLETINVLISLFIGGVALLVSYTVFVFEPEIKKFLKIGKKK